MIIIGISITQRGFTPEGRADLKLEKCIHPVGHVTPDEDACDERMKEEFNKVCRQIVEGSLREGDVSIIVGGNP